MKKVLPLLASRQFFAVLALVVVSLLIWFLGPFVSFGGLKPFTGIGMRVLWIAVLLGVVLAAFAVHLLLRLQRRTHEDKTILQKLLRFGGKDKESSAALRLEEIAAVASTALVRLKSMRTGASGLGKLFQRKRYLYELVGPAKFKSPREKSFDASVWPTTRKICEGRVLDLW